MAEPALIRLAEAEAFERPVAFRFPFRFGVARVTEAPQAFLRVRIETDGRRAAGWSAEMMMPKWFDKSPDLTPADNVAQLRRSLRLATDAFLAAGRGTPFGLIAAVEAAHHAACAAEDLPPLVASYGLALVERAMIDALARAENAPAAELVRANRIGLTAATAPDLAGFDLDAFLADPAPGRQHRRPPHRRPRRPADRRRPRARRPPERRPPRDARGGHRRLRPPLLQAQDRRRPRGRRRPPRPASPPSSTASTPTRSPSTATSSTPTPRPSPPSSTASPPPPASTACGAPILFLEQPMARAITLATRLDARRSRSRSTRPTATSPPSRPPARSATAASRPSPARASPARSSTAPASPPAATRCFISAEDLTTQAGIAVQQDLLLATPRRRHPRRAQRPPLRRRHGRRARGRAGALPRRPPRPLPRAPTAAPASPSAMARSRSPASPPPPASARPSSPTGRR